MLTFLPLLFVPACGDLDEREFELTTERKGTSKQTTDDTEDPLSPISPKHPEPGPGDDPDPDPDPPPVPAEKLEGLHIKQLAGLFDTVSYEMSFRPSSHTYAGPEIEDGREGWPAHGMQWKSYEHGDSVNLAVASTSIAADPNDFGQSVLPGDAGHMNDLEAVGSGVFTDIVGLPTDPHGSWLETSIPGSAQAFAYAALVMHFWRSPVYLGGSHLFLEPALQGNISETIALQQLSFDVPTGTDLLSTCGIPSGLSPAASLGLVLNCNQGFTLNGGETSTWNGFLYYNVPVEFVPNYTMDAATLIAAHQSALATRHMVFDPPEEATDEDLLAIRVMSEALAGQMMLVDEDGILITVENFVADLESDEKK